MDRRTFLASLAAATAVAGSSALPAAAAPADSSASSASSAPRAAGRGLNILMLTGSPRRHGNTSTMADAFARGAGEAGHTVFRFDAAFKNVHPCTACNACGMDGPCVFDDDFACVREHIVDADMVVLVSPMYYFGFSAQLKRVIDRFYAINGQIHVPKKAALLMAYADTNKRKENCVLTHYAMLLDYLGWSDAGHIIAPGMWSAGAIRGSAYLDQACRLGRTLRA